jgi:ubiquinone/menaquinone biosynthesis C-methylase UbiE
VSVRTFDFAAARFLFQHLTDPVSAAREVHRVLKPRARLVIIDVDDDCWGMVDAAIPGLATIRERSVRA